MAYTLGDITLPSPVNFKRETLEVSAQNLLLDGTTKKNIVSRKERYVLEFTFLTQAQVNSILSEYNLKAVRDFAVSETNLTINSTPVHIDIPSREYNTKGEDYREDLVLILTEVS